MSTPRTPKDTKRQRAVPPGRREEHATDMDAIDAIDAVHGASTDADKEAIDAGEPTETVDDRRVGRSGAGLSSTAPSEQDADAAASETVAVPDGADSRGGSDAEGDVERAAKREAESDVERGVDTPRSTDDTFRLRRDRF